MTAPAIERPAEPDAVAARGGRRAKTRKAPRERRPPAPPPQGAPAVVGTSSAMVAILSAWLLLHLLALGGLAQQRAQDLLYPELRAVLAGDPEVVPPLGPFVDEDDPGRPVALLRIPRLGLEQVVVEGTAAGDLTAGPGHKRNTVLPGQVGASVVYGRSTTYGAPFRDLASLSPGNTVLVTVAQGEVVFTVIGVRREGSPLPQPAPDGAARLTLVTSEGQGRLGALRPGKAVYVDAEAAEGFPAPSGRATSVPESEDAMARGTEALPSLALYLTLLIALTVLVILARQRWSPVLVWMVAAPVALAVAWAASDAAMRLLPNLI